MSLSFMSGTAPSFLILTGQYRGKGAPHSLLLFIHRGSGWLWLLWKEWSVAAILTCKKRSVGGDGGGSGGGIGVSTSPDTMLPRSRISVGLVTSLCPSATQPPEDLPITMIPSFLPS